MGSLDFRLYELRPHVIHMVQQTVIATLKRTSHAAKRMSCCARGTNYIRTKTRQQCHAIARMQRQNREKLYLERMHRSNTRTNCVNN